MLIDVITDFIKGRLRKIGVVSDWLLNPCDAPLTLYIEKLPGALKDPVIMLLSFGFDDVARGALRPKGIYGKPHLRTRRGPLTRPLLPELGEEIGKRIPGAEEIKGRTVTKGEKLLWLGDTLIQRVLYYLLIFDFVTDSAYNLVSAVRADGFCLLDGHARAMYQANPLFWEPIDFTPLYMLDQTMPQYFRRVDRDESGQLRTPAPIRFRYFVAWRFRSFLNHPVVVTVRTEADPPHRQRFDHVIVPALGQNSLSISGVTRGSFFWSRPVPFTDSHFVQAQITGFVYASLAPVV
jgi:hypothetical protein